MHIRWLIGRDDALVGLGVEHAGTIEATSGETRSILLLMAATVQGSVLLSGCAALQAGPQPLRAPALTNDAQKVAHVSVAVTNVTRLEDIAEDLSRPQFAPKEADLLADAVQVTSSVNAQTIDALSAAIAATVAGASVNRSETSTTDATGAMTTAGSTQRGRQTPAAPDLTFNFNSPAAASAGDMGSVGTEAQLKYDVAKALAEEIAIKNREISTVTQRTGYRPYFVNIKVAIEPLSRLQPYDVALNLTFRSSAPIMPTGLSQHISEISTVSNPQAAGFPMQAAGAGGYRSEPSTSGPIIVVPLLVTDAMESTREAQTAQIVRQLGASLKASGGFVGASASLQRTLSRLDQTLAQRSNSLLTVAQRGESGVRVRLGANAYGEGYELISRTHSISLILLVPIAMARQKNPLDRLVSVEADLIYSNATGVYTKAVRNDPAGPFVASTVPFEIPRRLPARCPRTQDLPVQVTGTGDSTPKLDVVTLSDVDGLSGRRIVAEITAPAPKNGGHLHFTTFASPSNGAGFLQIAFQEHSAYVGGAVGALRTGAFTFSVLGDADDAALECPSGSTAPNKPIYRVIYPIIAATPTSEAGNKPKPAAGKSASATPVRSADLVAPSSASATTGAVAAQQPGTTGSESPTPAAPAYTAPR